MMTLMFKIYVIIIFLSVLTGTHFLHILNMLNAYMCDCCGVTTKFIFICSFSEICLVVNMLNMTDVRHETQISFLFFTESDTFQC